MAKPVVKWAGGKTQMLSSLLSLIPKQIEYYVEPFIGGGAVFFKLEPKSGWINDANPELINLYEVILDNPEKLIETLKDFENSAKFYYDIRNLDRDKQSFQNLDSTFRAARFMYLNHTCFNGLYRVNSKDEFNVPFGRYKNPNIIQEKNVNELHRYLKSNNIKITCLDFKDCLKDIPNNSFVYLDPPYDSFSGKNVFTSYVKDGFGEKEQVELRDACDKLDKRGIKFMLSNSATDLILDLYGTYYIDFIMAKRYVGSKNEYRDDAKEVIVRNF